MNVVAPVTVAALTANIINALGNWLLVYGHLGLPAMGVVGSAYATLGARIYLALFVFVAILRRERRRSSGFHDVPFRLDLPRVWQIGRLGVPAALQMVLEVGVFAAASALAGRISPMALAANQIVLNIAGFLFMIPLGLNSAAAVRVGQAVGAGDAPGMRAAGWTALCLAGVFHRPDVGDHRALARSVPSHLHRRTGRDSPSARPCSSTTPSVSRSTRFSRRDRRPARSRRNANADDRQPHRPLADRSAHRLLVVLPARLGRDRPLGRADVRSVPHRIGADVRMAQGEPTGASGHEAMGQ